MLVLETHQAVGWIVRFNGSSAKQTVPKRGLVAGLRGRDFGRLTGHGPGKAHVANGVGIEPGIKLLTGFGKIVPYGGIAPGRGFLSALERFRKGSELLSPPGPVKE